MNPAILKKIMEDRMLEEEKLILNAIPVSQVKPKFLDKVKSFFKFKPRRK